MPTLTEKPAFWIAFLLFETAVPMLVPNRVWAGFAMLLFGSIFYSSALGWLRLSMFHAALPSAGVFLGAAVVSSLAAAGAVGWYDKIVLERDASELSSALLDFSNECRARMFPSLTPAQKLEEEHHQRT